MCFRWPNYNYSTLKFPSTFGPKKVRMIFSVMRCAELESTFCFLRLVLVYELSHVDSIVTFRSSMLKNHFII